MSLHLAVAGPLPPARTGPADYVGRSLPALAELAEITCLTADPGGVDPDLRRRFRVRSLDERHDPAFDLVAYHVANNPFHEEVVAAAMAGPPGLLVLHDGSIHHLMSDVHLKHDLHDEYRLLLEEAHGAAGSALASVRSDGARGDVDLFLYDLLRPLVDRHLGVVVHSQFAADLVTMRAPGTRVWVVPHFAHLPEPAPRSALPSLPTTELLIGHFGFVTPPKRPVEILHAFARLRRQGLDAHLVFCGADHTRGLLTSTIVKLGLRDHVTVTGYASETTMAALMQAVDVVISLRSPHVGETSGTLTIALAEGKAVIADSVGTWAELPAGVAERAGGGTEFELVESLTAALRGLAASPARRAALGSAAAAFAADELDVHRCMRRFVDAAKEIVSSPSAAPIRTLNARAAAVAEFLGGGVARVTEAVADTGTATSRIIARAEAARYHSSLQFVPPARPGEKLLDLGAFAPMMRVFETVWGYRVRGCNKPPTGAPGRLVVELEPSGGLPAYTAEIDLVDIEAGRLPFGVGEFDVITAWEVFEHMVRDPMALLWECNRLLRPGGTLVLTTPNVVSTRAVHAALDGGHPYLWSQYQTTGVLDRHQREYTPNEIRWLLRDAGFGDDGVTTCDVWTPHDEQTAEVLGVLGYNTADRGDNLVAVARKIGLPGERYPAWLYHS